MLDPLCGAAATFSKSPKMWSGDPDWQPQTLSYGRGARVYDGTGGEWLDYVSGLGAILLGYPDLEDLRNPATRWAEAVCTQVFRGAGFSLPHRLERQVAERLVALLGAHVPGWSGQPLGLRWGKTGSDACEMAVRLARAVMSRKWVASVGYHGWLDPFVSTTMPAWGVTFPQYVAAAPFGDLEKLVACLDGRCTFGEPVAAVIIEQPPQPIPEGYWAEVRRLCDEHGALLILDEVVTFPRYALGGAAERFGIAPDLLCVGKALGNGLPISAIVGRREYFDWFSRSDPVFISSTHFGEAVSLAAADAVLDCWDQAAVDHIGNIGVTLILRLRVAGYEVVGYPPVFLVQHESPSHRAYFIAGMRDRGILANRPWIPNLAHTISDVEQAVTAAAEVKAEMDALGPDGVAQRMAGKLPAVLFSNR